MMTDAQYRQAAREKLAGIKGAHVQDTSTIWPISGHGGAFVEAVVWIPDPPPVAVPVDPCDVELGGEA